jgi:putative flippase GtrA
VSSSRPGLLGRLESRLRGVFAELAKFGTVGALSFLIDVTIFNAVLLFLDKPLTAKVISTVFSATNAFVLNRAWSFKHRERTNVRREYSLFFVLNAVGLSISLLCLARTPPTRGTPPRARCSRTSPTGRSSVPRRWSRAGPAGPAPR